MATEDPGFSSSPKVIHIHNNDNDESFSSHSDDSEPERVKKEHSEIFIDLCTSFSVSIGQN